MMKMYYSSYYQKGISLLECLFYMIVMASIIIASVAYFKASTREQKLTNALVLTTDLLQVAAQYWESNLTFEGLTENIAVESGLLPVAYVQLKQYSQKPLSKVPPKYRHNPTGKHPSNPVTKRGQVIIATPWTELYALSSVTLDPSVNHITITFNYVPDYACQPLAQRLRTTGYNVIKDCQGSLSEITSKNIYNSTVSVLVQRKQ